MNNAFQQGDLDILYTYSISKMISYKRQDWVGITETPSLSVTFAVINAARPLLNRKGVRQALSCAWDPAGIETGFSGLRAAYRHLAAQRTAAR